MRRPRLPVRPAMPIARMIALSVLLGGWLLAATPASAQPRLPYQAYGSGVAPNATVDAVKGDTLLSSTKADAQGNWMLQVSPDVASDGDTIGFRVNGKAARETITFRSARFSPPPGLRLTVEGQPTPGLEPGASGGASGGANGGGAPGASTPTAEAGATVPAGTEGNGSPLLWVVVILVIAAAVGGGAFVLLRRRGAPGGS